jgi:hypothetical protein
MNSNSERSSICSEIEDDDSSLSEPLSDVDFRLEASINYSSNRPTNYGVNSINESDDQPAQAKC